jgi:hypothetical protein
MGVPFLLLPKGDPMRVLGVGILFSICGIFGQSLTEWVYRQTPILFTFNILLGALAGLAHARRVSLAEKAHDEARLPDVSGVGGATFAVEGE